MTISDRRSNHGDEISTEHLRQNVPNVTGLLEEPPSGVWRVFSSAGIDVEHKKKVDLGVLRGAECHGHVPAPPFSTVDRVCVK